MTLELDVRALQLLRETDREPGLYPCAPTCIETCGPESCGGTFGN